MRFSLPRVHAKSPMERLARTLALLLVFAVVGWAFMKNSENMVQRLNSERQTFDQTGQLTDDDRDYVRSFTRSLKDEFGLTAMVRVYEGPVELPELDGKTLFVGLSPSAQTAVVVLPPLARRAVGEQFERDIVDHFGPYFERGDWVVGLRRALAMIFTALDSGRPPDEAAAPPETIVDPPSEDAPRP